MELIFKQQNEQVAKEKFSEIVNTFSGNTGTIGFCSVSYYEHEKEGWVIKMQSNYHSVRTMENMYHGLDW